MVNFVGNSAITVVGTDNRFLFSSLLIETAKLNSVRVALNERAEHGNRVASRTNGLVRMNNQCWAGCSRPV